MDDPSTASLPIWRDLAERVFASFEGAANSSPTIVRTLEYGSRYATIDQAAGEIVFDLRALYLGLLAAGSEHPEARTLGNSAAWFSVWLAGKVGGQGAIVRALEQHDQADNPLIAMRRGLKVLSSRSLKALLPEASAYAQTTVNRPRFDMRHLLAAMINGGVVGDMTNRVFKIALTAQDIEELALTLFMRVMSAPEPDESRDAWRDVLSIREAQTSNRDDEEDAAAKSGASTSRPPTDDAVSPFNGDTPVADDSDVLDTERDVEALAQLVCLDRVTPLAVAIFGDWGSGKSTFMARLEEAVRDRPGREAGAALPLVDEASAARFVHPIVQIRFNAWHFADANLWASLTAEFFDQLRAGGYDRSGQARHAQLVQRVNQHVHALSDTLSANRKAMARNGEAVLEAQKARDTAAEGARRASGKALGQATLDVLSQVLADQKGLMTTLGLTRERARAAPGAEAASPDKTTPGKAGQGAEVVVGVVKDLASTFGKLKAMRRVLFRTPLRAAIAGGLLLALLAGAAAGWAILQGPWKAVGAPEKWTALLALLAAAGGLVRTVAPVLKLVNGVAERGAAVAAEVDKADQDAVGLLLTQEARLRGALAEAQALEEAEAASARALARYVDPSGKANPPRLLRYVLEDDPDTKALEKDIGLIGRTRRLFQAVDSIASEVRAARREKGYAERKDADWETPERIIIYIDDLDRCHEDKVYEVLQAIHLLLAFDLFVVVVGVDVRWVQAALAKQFETGDAAADAASEAQRNERAMHYLEKIFQIPFWLRPLSSGDDGTFRPFVEMLAGESVETAWERQSTARAEAEAAAARAAAGEIMGAIGPNAVPPRSPFKRPDPAAEAETDARPNLVEARRKLQLTDAEIAFLGSPEIAALASAAPRGVKRLVNVYRIARARRGQEDGQAVLGSDQRPPDYPLLVLMAAIETGQGFKVAEAFYDLLEGHQGETVSGLLAEILNPPPLTMSPPGAGNPLKTAAERLLDAVEAANRSRKAPVAADDLLAAARLVRRYSFNRYR